MGFKLNILGTLELRDAENASVASILQQPRRLALLVYLAMAERDAMVKRDTLLGLFWPDMSQENGRRALSQAIHFLRRALGRDAIIGRGHEDVALNHKLVQCDAALFLASARAGDVVTAASLYSGELLPGFFVSGVQEFEQWLAVERDNLRRRAADVFWSAAEHARQQGQAVSAAASARRAAELAIENESATRRLMEFLESIEDRAGALDAYDGLVRKLNTEYESTPSAKTRELAEKIRRSGDGDVVTEIMRPAAVRGLLTLPWSEIKQRGRTLTGSAIIMVAFVSLWGLNSGRGNTNRPLRTDASIMIDAPVVFDAALAQTASMIAADAAAALVPVPNLTVVADDAPNRSTSTAAHFVLTPQVSREGNTVQVKASVVDRETGSIVRSADFSAPADDQQALRNLAVDMAEFARKAMGRQARLARLDALSGPNAELLRQSMRLRLRVDSLRDQGLMEYALLMLDRADSSLAHVASAEVLVERADIARARTYIYLTPTANDPASAAAAIKVGIAHADAAIEAEPRNAAALELRGLFAYNQWQTPNLSPADAEARRTEAEQFLRAAVQVNPVAERAWSALSAILLARGEFAEAYIAAERAHAADTYLNVANAVTSSLFAASLETGDLKGAERWCADIARRADGGWLGAYCALQLIARSEKLTSEDGARAQSMVDALEGPTNELFLPLVNSVLAVVHARSGKEAQARALLNSKYTGPMADEAQVYQAWALMELGGRRQALTMLNQYIGRNPAARAGVLKSVRFASRP